MVYGNLLPNPVAFIFFPLKVYCSSPKYVLHVNFMLSFTSLIAQLFLFHSLVSQLGHRAINVTVLANVSTVSLKIMFCLRLVMYLQTPFIFSYQGPRRKRYFFFRARIKRRCLGEKNNTTENDRINFFHGLLLRHVNYSGMTNVDSVIIVGA